MTTVQKYDPKQPRDNAGRWTSGGISGLSATEAGWSGSYEVKNATYTGKSGRTYQLQLQDVSGGRGNAFVLTAEHGYDRAGQLQITNRGTDDTAVIDWVETQPEFRRDGLATAMLGFARRDSGLKVVHDTELSPDGLAWSSVVKYDPNQPRDDSGRWTSGGGSFGGTVKVTPKTGSPEAFADTRMSHQAPTNDGFSAPMSRVTDIYPKDVLSHNGARYYGHYSYGSGEHASEDEAVLRTLRRVQGHPDAKVTVYRTILARDDGSQPDAELRPGDWVTPSLQYAKDHARDDRSYLIVEADVPASQLYTDANSLMEWGYDPNGEVKKYNPNQPRDQRGRFSSTNSVVHTQVVMAHPLGVPDDQKANFANAVATATEALSTVVDAPIERLVFNSADAQQMTENGLGASVMGYYNHGAPGQLTVRRDVAEEMAVGAMVHEFGHLLDAEHSGYRTELLSDTPDPATVDLFEALNSGSPYYRVQRAQNTLGPFGGGARYGDFLEYASSDPEVFARGFAQYVAFRSSNRTLQTSIESEMGKGQWQWSEFAPIADAFDGYLAAKGLAPKVQKYSPNQPRDDRGRFSETGGTSLASDASSLHATDSHAEFLGEKTALVADAIRTATGLEAPAKVYWVSEENMALEMGEGTKGYYKADTNELVVADGGGSMFFMTHEYGHMADREVFGKGLGRFASDTPGTQAFRVIEHMRATPEFKQWLYEPRNAYWASNREMFARGFAQYVAMKSGESFLTDMVADQASRQWSEASFAPIAAAFDALFA